ncbi:MAG: YpdA family putative bacillithiol disulfide reductase [Cytophagales bacterium]|jgi:thioredoxin reductase (NADPH)|nr:YpdA family putative bacillithiol disulfide reductase [Cytophagales bacterium]
MDFDVCIIGAGPIGICCAIEAKKNNLNYVIIDRGCLVNSLYNYPKNMTFFSTSDKLEIGGVPFISHNSKPTKSEALEYYRRVVSSWELKVNLYEEVSQIKKTENFEIITSKGRYISKNVIISTGFYDLPYKLNVPGETLDKVKHYYDEPHPYFGMKVAVVGAANSAVDVALETYRKGAKEVTMIVREPNLSETVKYWVKPDVENRINEGSIKSYFNSNIKKIDDKSLTISTPEGELVIENDFVLAMTGYQPDFSFLKRIGIEIGEDEYTTPFHNPDTMETNVDGVYLAGVICGGLKTNKWFIENSRDHSKIIIKEIKKNNS